MSKTTKKVEEVPVTAGIRGILRKHICESMLDKVQSPYKILVMDVEASELINSCFKMHDIMEHGVTLVTPINKARQPVKSCVAIYFVAPKAENMALLVNDWKDTQKMMYKEPHLFFTTAASDPVLAHLGGSNAVAQLKSLFDLRIEFHAPEPLFFNLKMPADMQALYGSTYSPIKVGEIGSKIASALLVAGERPTIRAYNSDLCKSLAAKVKTTLEMESAATANTSGVLIIVDRAIDMIAPLLHEYTYEAFVADNRPLIKDQLEYKTESGEAKKVLIDMDDNVWCLMRHKHLGQLGQELAARMQELKDKFPKLMEFSGSKATASTKDLGDAVRDLPAFNAMKQNISTHQYLVNDVMKVNTNGKLQALGEFEQCVVMGLNESGAKVDAKAALKIAADIVKSPDYDQSVKRRFCMLTVAALGPSYLEEVAKLLKPTDKSALEAVAKLFDVGAKDKMSRSKKSESDFFISSYKGYVKTIMEQAIAGTLDTTTFPIISGDAGGANGGASAADAAPAKGGGLFGGATRRPGTAGASKSSSAAIAANLDLGHGQLLPLTSKARVWVFIAGGATRSEIRAAYEVAAQLKREVILGSTSVVSSSSFAELVASMS